MATKKTDSYTYKLFKYFTRKFKINHAGPPQDVKEAFSKFAGGGDRMSADQLGCFLVEHQLEVDVDAPVEADRILKEVLRGRNDVGDGDEIPALKLEDFFCFLFRDDLNGPLKAQVHHDMSSPLSHYFIYTGHNSYLTGNQLTSYCSVLPIIKALQRGVRGIELDLWPGSKHEVLVLHGWTLTPPVPLIKCLISIKDYAFVKSPYPVILTFEDHLTPDLQARVAEMITQTFGEMLYHPQAECLTEFPSPESLKHKIIISTKPPKEFPVKISPNGSESPEEETLRKETLDITAELEVDDKSDGDQDDEDKNVSDGKSSQPQLLEYKRLITIHSGKPKGGLKNALKLVGEKVRRVSLNEQALQKAVEYYASDLIRFTQRNILRVYPKGTRVTSSNYKPILGWIHGAQMVALNMQGYGKSLWLMHGMFRANGECGYVKKPDFLMQKGSREEEVFDPKGTLPVKTILKVKVYMSDGWRLDFSRTHFDTFSPPDFYTKVWIVGVPADSAKKKTKIIADDWAPVWDEEFEFPLTIPELALLRIEVREYNRSEKNNFGGQTCLPVSELKSGFRAVPLFDKKGEKLKSVKILMRFYLSQERRRRFSRRWD
ncbi:hypothetical protein UlMin_025141 [Ulmus minor]